MRERRRGSLGDLVEGLELRELERDVQEERRGVHAADDGAGAVWVRRLDVGKEWGHGEWRWGWEAGCAVLRVDLGGPVGGGDAGVGTEGLGCGDGGRAETGDVDVCVGKLFAAVQVAVDGCWRAVEDGAQAEAVSKAALPAGFGPPADDIFAQIVHIVVCVDHVENPSGEDVDVCVAVGGQHSDVTVLPD